MDQPDEVGRQSDTTHGCATPGDSSEINFGGKSRGLTYKDFRPAPPLRRPCGPAEFALRLLHSPVTITGAGEKVLGCARPR